MIRVLNKLQKANTYFTNSKMYNCVSFLFLPTFKCWIGATNGGQHECCFYPESFNVTSDTFHENWEAIMGHELLQGFRVTPDQAWKQQNDIQVYIYKR